MANFILIGGGEINQSETKVIDRHALELSDTKTPNALFIPTASKDAEGYIGTFNNYFRHLGALPTTLCLSSSPTQAEITDKMHTADVIYVGGGNTRYLLSEWRKHDLPQYVESAMAAKPNLVLSGLSAGAIVWGVHGSTDSNRFDDPNDRSLGLIDGLGYVDHLISPHHIREAHRDDYLPGLLQQAAAESGNNSLTALALDDGAAAVFTTNGDRYAIAIEQDRRVREFHQGGEVIELATRIKT